MLRSVEPLCTCEKRIWDPVKTGLIHIAMVKVRLFSGTYGPRTSPAAANRRGVLA